LWSIETGKLIKTLGAVPAWRSPPQHKEFAAPAFSTDGKLLAGPVSWNTITVWETSGGQAVRQIALPAEGGQPRALAFSPDGRMLVLNLDDDRVALRELSTGGERRHFRRKGEEGKPLRSREPSRLLPPIVLDGAWSLAVSPDGRWVALPGEGHLVHVWDVATGEEV